MLTFDHDLLIRRAPGEVARFRRWLLESQAGDVKEVNVAHEHDNSCCRREPWLQTFMAIHQAVQPPGRMIVANLPPTPARPGP